MADWLGKIRHDVLLVEDHLDTLAVTARLLRFEGFNVTTAANAAQALRLAEDRRFDVLVADVGLPDGDGLTLLRRLRQIHPTLPAIALTGYGMVEDVERNLTGGFDRHLTKPVTGAELVDAIHEMLVPGWCGAAAAAAAAADAAGLAATAQIGLT